MKLLDSIDTQTSLHSIEEYLLEHLQLHRVEQELGELDSSIYLGHTTYDVDLFTDHGECDKLHSLEHTQSLSWEFSRFLAHSAADVNRMIAFYKEVVTRAYERALVASGYKQRETIEFSDGIELDIDIDMQSYWCKR